MNTLWQQYQQLKSENAYLFQYDAAKLLNVSEGALLTTAPDVHYLGQDYLAVLQRLSAIQEVQLMVRNGCTVHEKNTRIQPLKTSPHVIMAIDVGGYDVRMFPKHWQHVMAYDFESRGKTMRSIQFFDAQGHALQKVYLRSDDTAVWQAIIDDFKQPKKLPSFAALAQPQTRARVQLSAEDTHAFQQRWRAMSNVHQFFGLMADYKLNRLDAFQHAPAGYAFKLGTEHIETVLRTAAAQDVPLIQFVGNDGIIQIQTGTVKNISRLQGWLNIFDAKHNGFTLHLDDSAVYSTWLVLRPTQDGIVSCIDCLDREGNSVLTIFGQRVEGQAELEAWRNVLQQSTGHSIVDKVAAA